MKGKQTQTWALVLFSIGVFMAALDNGIISAALTTLTYSFDVAMSWGTWSVTIYTLGLAISVPVVGKLSDRYGRKRLFLIEVALFSIGSLLVALSPNFVIFLVSRFIQSMGGGGIFIIASSYILSTFPKQIQGKALGLLGGMNGIASVLGPNVGSFILDWTGNWHWLFLINLPIGIALFILGIYFLQESVSPQQAGLDYMGAGLLMVSILSFMYGLTNLEGVDLWASLASWEVSGFLLLGIVLAIILLLHEKRVSLRGGDPVLPYMLLKRRGFLMALTMGFLSGGILASVIFIPAFVEQFFGVASSKSGYWFTPLALASGLGAGAGGAFTDRRGPVRTLVMASLCCIVGFVLFPLWVDKLWQMVVASCIVGFGFGTMLGAPINVLATEQAKSDQGSALGTLSLFRQIGMTLLPTIYAGFLARSFANMGENIRQAFIDAGYDASAVQAQLDQMGGMGAMEGSSEFAAIMDQIAQIPVPQVRDILEGAIHQTVANGFNGLFTAAVVVSVITLLATMLTGAFRKKDLPAVNPEEGGTTSAKPALDAE